MTAGPPEILGGTVVSRGVRTPKWDEVPMQVWGVMQGKAFLRTGNTGGFYGSPANHEVLGLQ